MGNWITEDFGGSGSVIDLAPDLASATGSITGYLPWANATIPVVGGSMDLPVDLGTLFVIEVYFTDPLGKGYIIGRYDATSDGWGSGGTVAYSGCPTPGPQPQGVIQTDADQPGCGIKFLLYNTSYEPIVSVHSITGLTIAAAGIPSATVTDVVALRWQGTDTSLCSVIEAVCGGTWPGNICMWIDKSDGAGKVFQGWLPISATSRTVYIGLPTAAITGAPQSEIDRLGMQNAQTTGVQHPPTTGDQTWTMYLAPWSQLINDTAACPATAISQIFTAVSIAPVSATAITGIQFVPNPATYEVSANPMQYLIDYVQVNNGYQSVPHELDWTQPDLGICPDYFYSFPTVQKGYSTTGNGTVTGGVNLHSTSGAGFTTGAVSESGGGSQIGFVIHVNGVWNTIAAYVDSTHVTLSTPTADGTGLSYEIWNRAPDDEGVNSDPNLATPYDVSMAGAVFFGRKFTDSGELTPGGNSIPGTLVQYFGGQPPDWGDPIQNLPDGTPYLYRSYRYLMYGVSRRAMDPAGGIDALTLQQWPDGSDHFDLTPIAQPPNIDLTQVAPFSLKSPLGQDPGTKQVTVLPASIDESHLAANAVSARTMATNAINVSNSQTVIQALALVDALIAGVGLSKLGAGTTVYNNVSVFTADIILSRGSGQPLISLSAVTGCQFFSAANSPGNVGLTSLPYVSIQPSGVLVSTGGTGPSVLVGGGYVTIFGVNGSYVKPYVSIASGGMGFHAPIPSGGSYTTGIDVASGLVLQHTTAGNVVDAQVQVASSGITLSALVGGVFTNLITANASGLTLATGTVLTSPVVTIVSGTITINIDRANFIKITDSSSAFSAQLTNSGLFVQDQAAGVTYYAGVTPITIKSSPVSVNIPARYSARVECRFSLI